MGKNILIIDGHPDPDPARFCHALAAAYAEAALSAGYAVEIINLSAVELRLLRTRQDPGRRTLMPGKLTGKSARVIVTMGMPAFIYRWYFSLRSLERNILRFVGLKPIRHSIIGSVEASAVAREKWVERARQFGREAI